jgi:hypothetical protein
MSMVLCPHEDGWSEQGVHHVQLAYAPYAALLAAFAVTSLLGVGMRRRRQAKEIRLPQLLVLRLVPKAGFDLGTTQHLQC